ncbi:YihY/virulence factor BrkB family protein [Thermodesulfobacteriota bacterium]
MTLQKKIDSLKLDLWRIPLETLSPKRSFLIKQLRIIVLAFKGFDEDKCSLRASALTFYSLLSVVPAAALAFGIAKGFGMQRLFEKELLEKMKGQEEVVTYIINFANATLNEAKGGLIAGIGIVLLVWLIVKLLGNIEKSFNEIWGVPHSRPLGRKLSDYLSILFVAPILFIMSSSITVFVTTQITRITQKIDLIGPISPVILFSLKALPYCVIWLLFTFVYTFMPNTKVRFRSGILGGIAAGTVYEIVQWIYITFQVGASKYGAIYGSFAVLPLFMIWLQVSWLIVLFGAEISFAHQNVETYELEPDALKVSHEFKRLLALRIAHICIKNFSNGEKPWTAGEISNALGIPVRLTNQILADLVQCRVLSETKGTNEKDPLYQPARDVDTLSINFIIQAFDGLGGRDLPLVHSEEIDRILECMKEFRSIIDNSKANLLLKNI